MKITEILSRELIVPALTAETKNEVMREVVEHLMLSHGDSVPSTEDFVVQALLDRERLGSTGVGEGVAIPHAKIPGLKNLIAAFGRSTKGIQFNAIDNHPVGLVFVLLVPENSAGTHLKALARISRLLKKRDFRDELLALDTSETIYDAFCREDARV